MGRLPGRKPFIGVVRRGLDFFMGQGFVLDHIAGVIGTAQGPIRVFRHRRQVDQTPVIVQPIDRIGLGSHLDRPQINGITGVIGVCAALRSHVTLGVFIVEYGLDLQRDRHIWLRGGERDRQGILLIWQPVGIPAPHHGVDLVGDFRIGEVAAPTGALHHLIQKGMILTRETDQDVTGYGGTGWTGIVGDNLQRDTGISGDGNTFPVQIIEPDGENFRVRRIRGQRLGIHPPPVQDRRIAV